MHELTTALFILEQADMLKCCMACRKGKHLWLELDSGPALMLHFGMTGYIVRLPHVLCHM